MNKSDLAYFKNLLNERKSRIKRNIAESTKDIEALSTSHVSDELDQASISIDRNIEEVITSQQSRELSEIEYALNKIESGSYGICEMCEEDIRVPRLKVKPHAKYCIACRELIEKDSKFKRI